MHIFFAIILTTKAYVSSGIDVTNPDPPVWPDVFHVNFSEEVTLLNGTVLARNKGSWWYDFTHRAARFDHGRGQHNNFCQGQGLSPHDKSAPCYLHFNTSGDFYVDYPETQNCCRLCGSELGCTVLRPDWLENSTYAGEKTVAGRTCYGWWKQGAVAIDEWFVTQAGSPCQYWEKLQFGFIHFLTFDPQSYVVGRLPSGTLKIPNYCLLEKRCPNPFPR